MQLFLILPALVLGLIGGRAVRVDWDFTKRSMVEAQVFDVSQLESIVQALLVCLNLSDDEK
jgi:hypothetical protein